VVLSDKEYATVRDAAKSVDLTPTGYVAEAEVLAARGRPTGIEPGA
jgi:hypothetical protein